MSYSKDERKNGNSKSNNKKKGARRQSTKRPDYSDKYERSANDSYRSGRESDPMNDVSWYTKYMNLIEASAKFPFPYRPGMQLPVYEVNGATTQQNIPGVMALDWLPAPGVTATSTDPVNVTARELYARVRKAYSGALDVDPQEFVIYLMCMDSIYAYIACLKRLYRILNAYTPENYSTPDTLLRSMGMSQAEWQRLRNEKALLWQNINELVLQSRKFNCPAVMDVMNRHYWMNDNVYSDSNSVNSQWYIFTQSGFYFYKEIEMIGEQGTKGPGAQLYPSPLKKTYAGDLNFNNTTTTAYLFDYGLKMIQQLVTWDDAYIISGYFARAFEGVPNFIVDEIESNPKFEVFYEPEVLSQIENSRVLPLGRQLYANFMSGNGTLNFANLSQNPTTNSVYVANQYTINLADTLPVSTLNEIKANSWNFHPSLSIRSEAPTVLENVIATRLHAAANILTQSASVLTFAATFATEIPLQWTIWVTPSLNASYSQPLVFTSFSDTQAAAQAIQMNSWISENLGSTFDWRPIQPVMLLTGSNDAPVRNLVMLTGDFHNITTISKEDLSQLHRVCVMSEFNAFSIQN